MVKEEYFDLVESKAKEAGLNLPSLRKHQSESYLKIRSVVKGGKQRIVLMAPCSFGKTKLAAYMACLSHLRGFKTLFCVDNLELVEQTIATFEEAGLQCGVIQGNHPQWRPSAPVQIATIQTLAKRLEQGKGGWADVNFSLIFFDECHQRYKGFETVVETYPKAVVVGLSGTPWAVGMGQFYEDIVSTITVSELLDEGWLTPIDVYSHPCPSWAGVKTSGGDFVLTQAAKEYTPELMGDVVKTWEKQACDLSTIVYGCDKAHAAALAADFCAAGYVFVSVDSDTDKDERKMLIDRFKKGEIQGLSTCLITVKGFDATIAQCIVDCQPTKSRMRHYQKIGRIQRIHKGKKRSLILDFAGNSIRNGLSTDYLPVILNDGTPKAANHNAPKADADKLPSICLSCGFTAESEADQLQFRVCPNCGFKPQAMRQREQIAGDLAKLTGEDRHGKRMPFDQNDKAQWYRHLLYFGWACNYKKGWAKHAFKARFGEFPLGLPDKKGAKPPPIEVTKWAEAYQRKSAEAYKAKLKSEGVWPTTPLYSDRKAAIARDKRQKRLTR